MSIFFLIHVADKVDDEDEDGEIGIRNLMEMRDLLAYFCLAYNWKPAVNGTKISR